MKEALTSKIEKLDNPIENIDEINSIVDVFDSASDREYNFYKFFVKDDIISKVSERIKSNYTSNEEFDEDTGKLISSSEPTINEISDQFVSNIKFKYTESLDGVDIKILDGIPIAFIPESSTTNEYKDSGAFVIGSVDKPLGLGVVMHNGFESAVLDIQHELVHLAVHSISIGSLETVYPVYDDMSMLENHDEYNSYNLARSFIDEFLAYGTNLYEKKAKITPELIRKYLFYQGINPIPESFDIEQNGVLWSDILNKIVSDRSGKSQLRVNNFLIKKVKNLTDIDLTIPENKSKILNLLN